MRIAVSLCLLAALLLPLSPAMSAEVTARFSVLGSAARAERGDAGYVAPGNDTLTADQQSLRLMLDRVRDNGELSLHLNVTRQHLNGTAAGQRHSSDLFRYHELSHDWWSTGGETSSTRVGYELDRAVYTRRLGDLTLGIGRQPIDWGRGRFWQPLNVFGAFAPTDLDTDFKPGIDAAVVNWYPSAFSSLTAAYVLAPHDRGEIENSGAVHYRRQVGETSEMSLLAGRVIGNNQAGASFETDWAGMGWRIEGVHTRLKQTGEDAFFWIAGVDYQFEEGTLVAAEWYDNSRGATTEAGLAGRQSDQLVAYGLQQHVSRRVLGVSVQRDITPLLKGTYTLLASPLKSPDGKMTTSTLHQLNLVYSVSNESDLLLSLLLANGKGLNQRSEPQSEFGHLPASVTLRWRVYF